MQQVVCVNGSLLAMKSYGIPHKGQQAHVPLLLFNDIQELQNKMEALIDLENKKTEERLVSAATWSDITKNPSVLHFLKTHL